MLSAGLPPLDLRFSLCNRSLSELGNFAQDYYPLILGIWLSSLPLFSLVCGVLEVTPAYVSIGKFHREMQGCLNFLLSCVCSIAEFSLSVGK